MEEIALYFFEDRNPCDVSQRFPPCDCLLICGRQGFASALESDGYPSVAILLYIVQPA